MTVGFIGLGRMGRGMALNLLKFNSDLVVYDVSAEAAAPLVAAGAVVVGSIAELTRRADVVFTSLPGPPQVHEVILGPGGVYENLRRGHTLFDLSTSSVSLARDIAARFADKGAAMLDAPVSGGPAGAASGELVLWIGGDRAVFDRHFDVLCAIGRTPWYAGPVGSGLVIKLAHNVLGYVIMLAEAEVFSMAAKAGVDPLDLWQALKLGVVGKQSPLDMLTKQFLPGEFDTAAFALKLARKDVVLATEMAREFDVPMRLCQLTLAEMTEAIVKGMGDKDSRAYLQLQLQRSGVTIAVDPERLRHAVESTSTPALPSTVTRGHK